MTLDKILKKYTPKIKPEILDKLKAELKQWETKVWKQGCIDHKMSIAKNTKLPERTMK